MGRRKVVITFSNTPDTQDPLFENSEVDRAVIISTKIAVTNQYPLVVTSLPG